MTEFSMSPDGKQLKFSFTADRFLRGMVRYLVDELLQIAAGSRSISQFEDRLKNQTLNPFAKMAYPQGLYLSKVVYYDYNFERLISEPF